jgi:peroxiredoxin
LWDDVVALAETVYLEPTDIPAEQVKRLRVLGIALFQLGRTDPARETIAALEAMLTQYRLDRVAAADEAEAKAKAEKKPAAEVAKAMTEALQKFPDRRPPIEAALTELRGLEALARGDTAAAKKLFYASKDIPKDRLARYALAVHDTGWAERLAREDANAGPGQVARLAHLVDVLAQCGKRKEAVAEFKKLRDLAADADLTVPVMRRLAPLAQELGWPADWRNPRPPATDVGIRPPLEDLGPLYWEPTPAPEWRLPSVAGGRTGLSDYRGRPVVVIGFLGFGCVHCVEQLQAFAPVAEQYRAAGIELVSIGTDAPPSGEEAGLTVEGAAAVPFPVLADPDLTFFKAYRAYDDFEGRPLHGTFLIDAAGRIRWQDVGPEPFKDVTFLLQEAKRLLAIPPR